jgi:RNA polymerase sigma-70 factor (ECF subfamily)
MTPVDRREGAAALTSTVAADHARIIAAVIRSVGDWQLAEDALQDAYERALSAWSRDGVPTNPAGWLVTTARRRAIDLLRRAGTQDAATRRLAIELGLRESNGRTVRVPPNGAGSQQPGLADGAEADDLGPVATGGGSTARDPFQELGADSGAGFDDDRLRLIFTCAHPALPMEARVALTLRTVLGRPVAEIGRLFYTSEQAMQKRLVRARAKIAHAGIPYRVPTTRELPERMGGVLTVLYLLFTAGYSSPEPDDAHDALCMDAIGLVRTVLSLLPADAPEQLEASGLLALMSTQQARRRARFRDGVAVTMPEQDRTLWDRDAIAEAQHVLDRTLTRASHERMPVGPYVLQAAIALEHARPAEAADTDWVRITQLHRTLAAVAPSPSGTLARAVAEGHAHGPAAGLALLDGLDGLTESHLFHAVRGGLLEQSGDRDAARAAFLRAASTAPSAAECADLLRRADEVGPPRSGRVP